MNVLQVFWAWLFLHKACNMGKRTVGRRVRGIFVAWLHRSRSWKALVSTEDGFAHTIFRINPCIVRRVTKCFNLICTYPVICSSCYLQLGAPLCLCDVHMWAFLFCFVLFFFKNSTQSAIIDWNSVYVCYVNIIHLDCNYLHETNNFSIAVEEENDIGRQIWWCFLAFSPLDEG